jgi:hypothetical protein
MAASVLSLSLLAGSALAQDSAAPTASACVPKPDNGGYSWTANASQPQIITDTAAPAESGGFFSKIKNLFHRQPAKSDGTVIVLDPPTPALKAAQGNAIAGLPSVAGAAPVMSSTTTEAKTAEIPAAVPTIKQVAVVGPPAQSSPAVVTPGSTLPATPADSDILRTAQQIPGTRQPMPQGQQPGPGYLETETRETSPEVSVIPPGPEQVFNRDSEPGVLERIRQKALERVPPERVDFPDEPVLPTNEPVFRPEPPQTLLVEPNYVYYRRLLFEDINSERYGWDLGFIQPVVSTTKFLADLVALPYHLGTQPTRWYETDAGYCLPGDPVPYILYPPQLSVTGSIYEAGVVLALYAIFPG